MTTPKAGRNEPTAKQKEAARRYAEELARPKEGMREPSTTEQALAILHHEYGKKTSKDFKRPEIRYDGAKVIAWSAMKMITNDNVIVEDENKQVFENMIKYFILDPESSYDLDKGIWLWGNVGRGKDMLMTAMGMMSRSLRLASRIFYSESCRMIAYNVNDQKSIGYLKQFFEHTWLFRDLGYEDRQVKVWGNDHPIMEEILVTRYDNFDKRGILTHVTTNVPPDRIMEVYGSTRLDSRAKQMFNFIHLRGADKRPQQ
jgi:DNA replication protein DnaC